MKQLLTSLSSICRAPILSKPKKEEVLYAYLEVTNYAVSLVLVRSKDGIKGLSTMSINLYRRPSHVIYLSRKQY